MTTVKCCLCLTLLMLCLTALPASSTTRASNSAGPGRATPLTFDTGVEVAGHLSSVVTSVDVQGVYAFIGGGHEFAMLTVQNPASPQRLGYLLLSAPIQAIAVAGTFAYVLIGPDVLGVVDVASPSTPKLVGRVSVPGNPRLTGVAPDVAVVGNYVYVSGETGLHIFDRSNPVAPVRVAHPTRYSGRRGNADDDPDHDADSGRGWAADGLCRACLRPAGVT